MKMIKHRISLFVLSIFMLTGVVAAPVSKDYAQQLAQKTAVNLGKRQAKLEYVEMSTTARQRVISKETTTDNEPFYAFNIGFNEGFVIVSGDDCAPMILGYADKGSFDWNEMPDNMAEWFELNAAFIAQNSRSGVVKAKKTMPGTPVVEPLLDNIKWGQDEPYNMFCPTYTEGGVTKNYYVGCVATAATQIMYYHKYPEHGTGSKTYNMKGQTLTADFGATTYRWDLMVPDYRSVNTTQEQNEAVATLAYHFGVSVEMVYEKNGSGASSVYVPIALRDYFNYSNDVVMVKRDYLNSSEWMDVIKKELDFGRPVYYGGTSEDGLSGHAFVCDGYDDAGFVHINWGWYGKSNGYFLVNHLDPDYLGEGGGTGGFNRSQEVVIGIQPPSSSVPTQKFPMVYAASRLSCASFGTDFMLMSFIENYDNQPFNGRVAAVLTKDGNIVKVLHEENLTIDGIKDFKTGYTSVTLRDISTSVTGVAEGNYEIRLAVKGGSISDWMTLRHAKGYADHATAQVIGNQLMNIKQVFLHPEVKLLKRLNPEGEVYAKGAALFKVKLQNISDNYMLQNVVVRMTSQNDESKVYESEHYVNVYDGATEAINIVVPLNDDMEEGKYFVTMYEKGHENYPFDDSEVGVGEMELLPEKGSPHLRMNTKPLWSTVDGEVNEVAQGELVNIVVSSRNYGSAGEATAIARLTDIDSPEKTYVFRQTSVSVDKAKNANLIFSRRIPVDPGTYKIVVSYLESDGSEREDTSFDGDETIIKVVKNDANEFLQIVSFDMPEQILKGEKVQGKLVLASDKGFSGKVYVRIRPYTLLAGELAWMGNATIAAGNQSEIAFTYKPSLDVGRYLVMIEGSQSSKECAVGGYANGYRLIEIVEELTGINDAQTTQSEVNSNANHVYTLDGRRVSGTLKSGIYIRNGRKFVVK